MMKFKNRQIVLVIDATNSHQRKIAEGAAAYAHEQGNWDFQVVQAPLEHPFYLAQDPMESVPVRRRWRADGIIASFVNRAATVLVHKQKIPVVGIEAEYGWADPSWGIPYFTTNNAAIGRLAAEDLLSRGFARLAFCGLPHTRMTGWSAQRQAAFEQSAAAAGAPCSVFVGGLSRGRKKTARTMN